MTSVAYRPEIDGLRAIAVCSVILFHAGVPGCGSGFLGVDIFFVISGFLITLTIRRQLRRQAFSYREFVVRRVRRILPALAVVMIACVPPALWLLMPDGLENFGQSLFATSMSANNVLLYFTSGYWDAATEFKPLLHTWSLGVEEQFYLFYPFILIVIGRWRSSWMRGALVALAIASFLAMCRATNSNPEEAFYLLHTRAWELLCGAITAISTESATFVRRPLYAALGLALLVLALATPLDQQLMQFGMVAATIGATLYVGHSDSRQRSLRVMTCRPFVTTGLMSYSLYLWHQPIFAFVRSSSFDQQPLIVFLAALPPVVLLSYLSWRFIEIPFRSPKRFSWAVVRAVLLLSYLALSATGLALHQTGGLPSRLRVDSGETSASRVRLVLGDHAKYNESVRDVTVPNAGDPSSELPLILVEGNSLGRDFVNVLREAGLAERAQIAYVEKAGLEFGDWTADQRVLFTRANALIFASAAVDLSKAGSAMVELDGRPFWFVGPKYFGHNLDPLIRLSQRGRADVRLSIPPSVVVDNDSRAEVIGARYIDQLACLSNAQGEVRVADEAGWPLSADSVHLTRQGARFMASSLRDLVEEIYREALEDLRRRGR